MRPSSHISDPTIKPNWKIIRSLIPYLFEYKGRVVLAFIFLVAAKVATVSIPWMLKLIVDSLDRETAVLSAPIALICGYGLMRFMSSFLGEVRDTVFSRVTERSMRSASRRVFEHLHSLDLEFHLKRKTGGLSRDIERGASGINFLLRFFVFNILPTLLELAMVFGILLGFFDWRYCSVILLSIVAYVFFSVIVTEWRTRFIREVNELDSRSNSKAVDSLLNYETVKYFNNEQFEVANYDRDLALWEKARIRIRYTLTFLNSGQALIIALSMTSLLLMTATDVAKQQYTIGDFVMVNAYMIQLFIPLNFLGFVYREIRQALINVEKMFQLLDERPSIQDRDDCDVLVPKTDNAFEIEFKNVSFAYDQERTILRGVSFKVRAGETLAIVGASGAGKSTIAKLLFRFYDPVDGAIQLNGVDIRTLSLASLRGQIGVVPQDTVLFNDTIGYNIGYGRPSASENDILDAANKAQLSDFIKKLPKGLETEVGERGLKVSGGEKQRIAIARVLLKGSPILLFDEATSSLDTQAEQLITSELYQVARNHTTLVIAHRLSTVANADKILVLKDGCVVEQGSHRELLESKGSYAELWQAQSEESRA